MISGAPPTDPPSESFARCVFCPSDVNRFVSSSGKVSPTNQRLSRMPHFSLYIPVFLLILSSVFSDFLLPLRNISGLPNCLPHNIFAHTPSTSRSGQGQVDKKKRTRQGQAERPRAVALSAERALVPPIPRGYSHSACAPPGCRTRSGQGRRADRPAEEQIDQLTSESTSRGPEPSRA